MMDRIIGYVLSLYYNDISHVKKFVKVSLMGNLFSKTIDYYRNNLILLPTDDSYIIDFSYKNIEYSIKCNMDNYNNVIRYINDGIYIPNCDNLLMACEEKNGKFVNITHIVRKYYGPSKNFYKNTGFDVKKNYITDNDLYIIDVDFVIRKFTDSDILDMNIEPYNGLPLSYKI
jgi:hypothetical protein